MDESDNQDTRKQVVVGRPDRVGIVAMTARVEPVFRKGFKQIALEVDENVEEVHRVALGLFMRNFSTVPRSEWQVVWKKLSKLARGNEESDT